MIWLRVVLLVAAIAAGAAVVLAYNNAIRSAEEAEAALHAERERARQRERELQAERDGWIRAAREHEQRLRRYEEAVAEAQRVARQLRKERDDAKKELAELLGRADVRPWAESDIPDAVLDRLRGRPASGPVPRTGEAAAGASSASPAR